MKLRKSARVITIGILHILVLLPKALCSGVFELRLTSFTNRRGLNANGNCCNGVQDTTSPGSGPTCLEPCHTFFTICLTNYMSNIPPDLNKNKCVFGYYVTPVLGMNNVSFENIDGFSNHITFHFNISWPGTFSIIIESWHDATLSTPVAGSPRELIARLATQRHLTVGPDWNNFVHTVDMTSAQLKYTYRVRCDKDYYGTGCSKFCRPRDDHFGHYTCSDEGIKVCKPGWKGNYCDQAICLEGCEAEHGYCNRPNECICQSGWDGPFCKQCLKYPGCKNGTCTKPWECKCDEGWGGLYCTLDLNYCTHYAPCENGGICQNTGSGSYTCSCPEGYSGTNCEIEIINCLNDSCLNNGICEYINPGYRCKCPPGITGKRCDVRAASCDKNPCQNGSTCVETDGSYTCICVPGYTGRNCDEKINDCEPNPCEHGRCVDKENGFKCVCEIGFSGPYCRHNIDDCKDNPCKNNGFCLDGVNTFKCRCLPGFVGELCETNVDDCEMRPCAHGASCQDLVNDFKCTCRPGFKGRFCTEDINECESRPCRNGAECSDSVDDYHCACLPGFTGKDCQYLPGQTPPTTTEKENAQTTPKDRTTTHIVTVTRPHSSDDDDEDSLTTTQWLLIVLLGAGIPLTLIIIVVTVLLCRKRRSSSRGTSKEESDNIQNSINNKLRGSDIFTTKMPKSSSTVSNLTSKVSNEESDFNTLKSNRSLRPSSQIYIGDKSINKQLFCGNKDLHVHPKHRDFEKPTKKLDNGGGGLSINPSNLNVREYCSSQDIHYIDKHINRDTINRNSLLILEPQLHQEPHRHSSYYGDDVLATEV